MSALRFIEDLWSPSDPPNSPPKRQFVAGTLGGVRNAVWDFARLYLYEGHQREVAKKAIAARQEAREGARVTFLSEFLHLGDMTKEGMIIGIVSKGGHVTSLYHSKCGMRPESLTREAARELFAQGTMAVSVDESGRKAVTTIGWKLGEQLTIADAPAVAAAAPAAKPSPKPVPSYMAGRLVSDFAEQSGAPPASPTTQARLDDNARVAMARSAILNGRWGSPPRPS